MANQKKSDARTYRIDIRLTEAEHASIIMKAKACGMRKSTYARKVFSEHKPRLRMTAEERDALNSLTDARGDLLRIRNILKGVPDDVKLYYFRDESFMRYWVDAVNSLIIRWKEIADNLKRN